MAPTDRISLFSRHIGISNEAIIVAPSFPENTFPHLPPRPELLLISRAQYGKESSHDFSPLFANQSYSTQIYPRNYSTNQDKTHFKVSPSIEFGNVITKKKSISETNINDPLRIETIKQSISLLRKLFYSTKKDSRGYIVWGPRSLGRDIVSSNLIQYDERALVLSTGYFGNEFANSLGIHGVAVDVLTAKLGETVGESDIEKQLNETKYKLITITHVDGSTGVLTDLQRISKIVHKISPSTLIVVDAIYSTGVEEIRFDDWKLDFVITSFKEDVKSSSGVCICYASGRALEGVNGNLNISKSSITDFDRLTRIVRTHETENNNSIKIENTEDIKMEVEMKALNNRLDKMIGSSNICLNNWFQEKQDISNQLKDALIALDLKFVSNYPEMTSNSLISVYLPDNISTDKFFRNAKKETRILKGIHGDIAQKYFRIDRSGINNSDTDTNIKELIETIKSAIDNSINVV